MSCMFHIEVNLQTSKLVQTMLFSKGFGWSVGSKDIKYENCQYLCPQNDNFICYDNYPVIDKLVLNIDQFINWFNTGNLPYSSCILNDDYTAIINKDKMVVGCQTFDKETSIKLANAILKEMS
jgi:hypothetical protein